MRFTKVLTPSGPDGAWTGIFLSAEQSAKLGKRGRVPVATDLSLPGHPEVFIVGDLAVARTEKFPDGLPGMAQAAIQGGRYVARVIADEVHSGTAPGDRPAFRFRDKGTMATIGRDRAVAEVAGRRLTGRFAWIVWGVVHIMFLIGFRAKAAVMWNWIWNYLNKFWCFNKIPIT